MTHPMSESASIVDMTEQAGATGELAKQLTGLRADGVDFHCACGCDLFTEIEDGPTETLYRCSACGHQYAGIKATP